VADLMEGRRTDYILNPECRPLAVADGQRGKNDPYRPKSKRWPMATVQSGTVHFLSNGELTYSGITRTTMPASSAVYSQRDLERLLYLRKGPNRWPPLLFGRLPARGAECALCGRSKGACVR